MIRIGQEYEHVWGDDTALYCKVTGIDGGKVQVEQYSYWNHVTCTWEDEPNRHAADWNIKDFGEEAFWHQTISSMLEDRIWQK